jgi:hypothetical protein
LAEAAQSDELGIVTAFGPRTGDNNDAILLSSLVAAAAAALFGEKLKHLREELGRRSRAARPSLVA